VTTEPVARTLRWRPFRLPMRTRFETASGALEDRRGVLIELIAADGRRGVGEASPLADTGPVSVDGVLALLDLHGPVLLRAGAGGSLGECPAPAALRCALDVALLDLEGRRRGVPIAGLLAEQHAPWVAANAIIGGGPPEEVARHGLEALAAGYSMLKLKVGISSLEEDVQRVAALRAACPEATIRVDANCAWDEETAKQAIVDLYPHRIELLEQPVAAGDVAALARVRQYASTRIAADEALADPAHAEQVLRLRAADLLVLKPMVVGGLRPALTLAHRAAAVGIGAFVTTTYDSSIGIAASLHLAAAVPFDAAHGLGTGEHLAADVTHRTLLPRAGRLALPLGPGLGVDYDDAALDAVAMAPWREVRA